MWKSSLKAPGPDMDQSFFDLNFKPSKSPDLRPILAYDPDYIVPLEGKPINENNAVSDSSASNTEMRNLVNHWQGSDSGMTSANWNPHGRWFQSPFSTETLPVRKRGRSKRTTEKPIEKEQSPKRGMNSAARNASHCSKETAQPKNYQRYSATVIPQLSTKISFDDLTKKIKDTPHSSGQVMQTNPRAKRNLPMRKRNIKSPDHGINQSQINSDNNNRFVPTYRIIIKEPELSFSRDLPDVPLVRNRLKNMLMEGKPIGENNVGKCASVESASNGKMGRGDFSENLSTDNETETFTDANANATTMTDTTNTTITKNNDTQNENAIENYDNDEANLITNTSSPIPWAEIILFGEDLERIG